MGCWSESCAISGLEIGDQDEAMVMLLHPLKEKGYTDHGAFSRYEPVCPPTWGKYSDYGDIEDINTYDNLFFTNQLELARRTIDPNSDDHCAYMARFWWVRKDVWDFCDKIPHEFSYGDHPKTIGESIMRRREKLNAYVASERIDIKNSKNDDPKDSKALIRRLISKSSKSGDDVFGLKSHRLKLISNLENDLDEMIEQNNQSGIDNVIEAVCRLNKIEMVCYELRKIVMPSTFTGPQHGGYEAASMLATFTLTKCQEHFAEYSED
jgi:hypothetical protein